MGILVGLPKLRAPVTYDSFWHWLQQLVQTKVDELSPPAADDPAGCSAGSHSGFSGSNGATDRVSPHVSSRLFQLRIVEEQPVDHVAQALGLTPSQVADREDDMLRKIVAILVRLDT
jgi:hypothetical protein